MAELVERSKRDGKMIDPNDSELRWVIAQFKIADDNLHAEPKKETA